MTEPVAGSYVVGTAGHIDHGKSSLVKALTDIDPDRLAEEKRRGMTIDLGFAYLDLPGGRRVGIVDVPGHQRFLKNMLAGVHGMDAVLLVIAADEGPMPQTREHLAILDMFDIRHGVVVLTKVDLVDDAWLSLVRDEVAGLLRETSLGEAPIIAVSSVTGRGLDDLRRALDSELSHTAQRPDLGRPRLPVDRSFQIAGFGTVVTGTLVGGSLRQGEEVAILPAGHRVRIRGLQQHNHPVEQARPGSRTAVNLSSIERSQVSRGDVLALPATLPAGRRIDVRLTVLASAGHPIRHRQRLLMYHETAEVIIELVLLGGDELPPGERGWAQLYADSPIVAVAGDRFILRSPAPSETVAGGVIVDSAPRRHRRRDPEVIAALAAREGADPSTALALELAKHSSGLSEKDLARRLGFPAGAVQEGLRALAAQGAARRLGTTWLARESYERLAARLTETLKSYHRAQPLRRGMPKEELRTRAGIPAALLSEMVAALVDERAIVDRGGELALTGHREALTPEQAADVDAFLRELEVQPFAPPPLAELVRRHHLTPAMVQYLIKDGRLIRVDDDTVFARAAYDEAVSRLRAHLEAHRTLTVAAARDLLGSSRRYILPLLEWMDAQKITRRVGDDRILRG